MAPNNLNPGDSNDEASSLFLNVDPPAPFRGNPADESPFAAFGMPQEQWMFSVGAVVIARLDRKPLHPLHASALVTFCREIQASLGDGEEARNALVKDCLREKFEAFFKVYKRKRVCGIRMSRFDLSFEAWDVPEWEKEARPDWTDTVSPYEL